MVLQVSAIIKTIQPRCTYAIQAKRGPGLKFELQMRGQPTAADVIYRNPDGIRNRLQLFHLLRLQKQEQLDRDLLQGWGTELQSRVQLSPLQVTSLYESAEPGCERQYLPKTAAVTVSLDLKLAKLVKKEEKALKSLAGKEGYDPVNNKINIMVDYFPFRSQNKQEAFEKISQLILASQGIPTIVKESNVVPQIQGQCQSQSQGQGQCQSQGQGQSNPAPTRRSKRQRSLAFPAAWLKGCTEKLLAKTSKTSMATTKEIASAATINRAKNN